jgi:hypothetical protein|tara:strand:+ start:1524 stop:2768 length:1245 start_codon:yes stop_codon:yes gene_type:complete
VGALVGDQIGGLDSQVLGALDPTDIGKLDTEEIQNMDGDDFGRFVTNLDPSTVDPSDVDGLLPQGWEIDAGTGDLTPPEGPIALKAVAPAEEEGVTLPEIPDLSASFGLGGTGSGGSVLNDMEEALDDSVPGFDMTQQSNGFITLAAEGSDPNQPAAALLPDAGSVTQAPEGAPAGISFDEGGTPILTTDDGKQVTLQATLANPEEVKEVLPGAEVEVNDDGGVKLELPDTASGNGLTGGQTLVGTPSPFVEESDKAPGVYREEDANGDETVTVVNQDGTAQTLTPTINNADEFINTAQQIDGVDSVTKNFDGSLTVETGGTTLTVKPSLELVDTSSNTDKPESGISVDQDSGSLTWTDDNGLTQTFKVVDSDNNVVAGNDLDTSSVHGSEADCAAGFSLDSTTLECVADSSPQ